MNDFIPPGVAQQGPVTTEKDQAVKLARQILQMPSSISAEQAGILSRQLLRALHLPTE